MHLRAARYDTANGHANLGGNLGAGQSAFEWLLPINQSTVASSQTKSRVIAEATSQLGSSGEPIDKAKQVQRHQLRLMNLVETCAVLSSDISTRQQNQAEALAKAREAQQVFNELQNLVQTLQTVPKSKSDNGQSIAKLLRAPHLMSLFELELMVISNLARQLELAGSPSKALELYTKLSKMVAPTINETQASNSSSARQQLSAHRFGLNMGNLYHQLGDFQRALRLYRLTFDRVSGQTGFGGLKLKLNNNIALTLVAMGQLDEAALTWQRLLADNQQETSVLQSQSSTSSVVAAAVAAAAAASTTTTTPQSAAPAASRPKSQQQSSIAGASAGLTSSSGSSLRPKNANHHHRFGLNLLLCLCWQSDSVGSLSALKSLAKVNICRHFERVHLLDEEKSCLIVPELNQAKQYDNSNRHAQQALSSTVGGQIGKPLPAAVYVKPSERDLVRSQPTQAGQSIGLGLGIGIEEQTNKLALVQQPDRAASGAKPASTQLVASSKQQVAGNSLSADAASNGQQLLASSSNSGGNSSLVGLRNLLKVKRNWLANTTETSKRNQQQQQQQQQIDSVANELAERQMKLARQAISADELERMLDDCDRRLHWALLVSCSLIIHSDSDGRDDTVGKLARQTDLRDQLNAHNICMQILESSPLDEWRKAGLVSDLRSSFVSKLLHNETVLATTWRRNFCKAQKLIKQLDLGGDTPDASVASSMAASNASLTNLLLAAKATQTAATELHRAYRLAKKAVQLDKQNVAAWINLANCHYLLREFGPAQAANLQALDLNPNSWLAKYNLALCQRQLLRLDGSANVASQAVVSSSQQQQPINPLVVDRTFASLLISKGMILSLVQLALIHVQTGNKFECKAILSDLLESSRKQAPEVHLLANKVNAKIGNLADQSASLGRLQQAYREHPYHLQLAERLIALSISSFNYAYAREILADCINNRPDQVKWHRMLAECHRRAADYNKAMAVYRKTIELFPRDAGCLKSLITLSEELGLEEETQAYKLKLSQLTNKRDTS